MIYVVNVWDSEAINGEGTIDVINGGWSKVRDWMKDRSISNHTDIDNIWGDPVYYWPKVKKYVSFKMFYIV